MNSALCSTCNDTGYVCDNCGDAEDVCDCVDGLDSVECKDCSPTLKSTTKHGEE